MTGESHIQSWLSREVSRFRFWLSGGPEIVREVTIPVLQVREQIERLGRRPAEPDWLWSRVSADSFELLAKNSRRRGYGLPLIGTLTEVSGGTRIAAHFAPHPAVRLVAQVWFAICILLAVAAAGLAAFMTFRNGALELELLWLALPVVYATLPFGSIRSAVVDAERVAQWFDDTFHGGSDRPGGLIPMEHRRDQGRDSAALPARGRRLW
jgi:hypothetical protein